MSVTPKLSDNIHTDANQTRTSRHLGCRLLRKDLFELIHSSEKTVDGRPIAGIDSYKCLASPMLFVTKDGIPLASIHLRPSLKKRRPSEESKVKDQNVISSFIKLKAKGHNEFNDSDADIVHFEATFSENNCAFELVLTNLCSIGHISFEIFEEGDNNKRRINDINDIGPLDSWVCRQDARFGCKRLILHKNSKWSTPSSSSASSSSEPPQGFRMGVIVEPEASIFPKGWFEGATWVLANDVDYSVSLPIITKYATAADGNQAPNVGNDDEKDDDEDDDDDDQYDDDDESEDEDDEDEDDYAHSDEKQSNKPENENVMQSILEQKEEDEDPATSTTKSTGIAAIELKHGELIIPSSQDSVIVFDSKQARNAARLELFVIE